MHVHRREDNVIAGRAALDLRQHLLVGRVGGKIDLDLGLFLEFLQDRRIDVFAPVVDVELGRMAETGGGDQGGQRECGGPCRAEKFGPGRPDDAACFRHR
ncbi:hypothetical protein D9M69_622520 [compost metagenome]